MNGLMKKDIAIRTASVMLAVLLWFFVLEDANPFKITSFTVPLKIINEEALLDKGLAVKDKNYQKNIVVNVKGRKEKVGNINQNDFEAVLDFSRVKDESDDEIVIDGPYYKGKEEIAPQDIVLGTKAVKIELEELKESTFHVDVETEGKLKTDFKVVKAVATPETVTVRGPESQLKSVSAVKAVIDVNNLDKDMSADKYCKAYGPDGKEILDVSVKTDVNVKLEVAKEVSVTVVTKGSPAKNFAEGTKRTKPDRILLAGPSEMLAKISDYSIGPIDIESISSNINTTYTIIPPNGTKLVNTPRFIEVSVIVEPVATKDFTVTKDNITFVNANNNLKYEVQTQSLVISVKGRQPDLDQVNAGDLKLSADMNSLTGGIYTVPLNLSSPGTMKLAQNYNVDIKID